MEKTIQSITENSIVKELFAQSDVVGIVKVEGFVGRSKESDQVRIYRDLTLSACIEVPRSAVLKSVAPVDPSPISPSTTFIKNTADVTYITKVEVSATGTITRMAKMSVAEVQRSPVRVRVPRTQGCSCNTTSMKQALQVDNGVGPELPPMDCWIRCELNENICGDHWWCWLERWMCDYECDHPGPSRSRVGAVIA